jgi:hypothetical protein
MLILIYFSEQYEMSSITLPFPVAARSKTLVYSRSLFVVLGSNPSGGHGCLSPLNVVCCHVEVSATG